MSQKDALVNIEIATETKRDSSAMKTIAVLTMVFLPGTFIAVCTVSFLDFIEFGAYLIFISPGFLRHAIIRLGRRSRQQRAKRPLQLLLDCNLPSHYYCNACLESLFMLAVA
jgi:hypothetical protein